MLAQLENVSLSFADKTVLDEISLAVHPGDRVALVGDNGSGKTSLLRVLAGRLEPDAGRASFARGVRVGHLAQGFDAPGDEERASCMQAALRELELRMERLSFALASLGEEPDVLAELGDVQQRFELAGGYRYRTRVESTLTGLGLPEPCWDREVAQLSAGQKMRLALARILLEENDLLLLDEPTNHLDLAAREWLEEHLAAVGAAYVIVSHDRRFLDAVARKVAHLDRSEIGVYPGNYSAFRRQLDEKIWADRAVYEKRQKAVRKLKKQARAYHEWSNAKEKEKRGAFDKGFVGARAAKLMKRSLHARNRLEGTIEEMENERPFEGDAVRVDFHGSRGRTLFAAEDMSVGFDLRRPLAKEVSFVLGGGDRLAVSGPNGSGKTTLLRTVLGEVPPLAGKARVSSSASVGYFDQENRRIKPEVPALRAVVDVGCDETLARTVLGRMRVRRDTVRRRFGDLSAGERAKVLLTVLVLGDHNLLVLDEPTNHLDVETQDVLLEALADFPGAILFVSHDRHFVETLATEALHLPPPRTAVAPGYRSKP